MIRIFQIAALLAARLQGCATAAEVGLLSALLRCRLDKEPHYPTATDNTLIADRNILEATGPGAAPG